MVTDFEELVALCDEELRHREYESKYYVRITEQWDCLRKWLNEKNISEFNQEIGNCYCDEMFGTHLMPRRSPAKYREKLRAVPAIIIRFISMQRKQNRKASRQLRKTETVL